VHSMCIGLFCMAWGLLILTDSALHAQGFPGDPVKGRVVYQQFCLRCHGEALDGKGPEAASLSIPPTNFHALPSRMKHESELRFTIKRGRDATAMHMWEDNLREDQIRDVSAYIRSVIPQEKP
jgi:mono/diheme cytochrome c family protein